MYYKRNPHIVSQFQKRPHYLCTLQSVSKALFPGLPSNAPLQKVILEPLDIKSFTYNNLAFVR